jgi:undecaprenyl diphosphate synthase
MIDHPIHCIGIIMDGNRRFAKKHGKSVFEGHRAGYTVLTEAVVWARKAGVPHFVAYAFSTENWQRTEDEVGYLMKLFRFVIDHEAEKMIAEKVRVRFVGDRGQFPEDIQKGMVRVEEATGVSYEVTLHVAVSYGGRAEILAATNALLAEGVDRVTEEGFIKKLWSYPMPDPDLIIRTGGEQRLSGFLPWQTVYSELFFVQTLWPEFSQPEFDGIIADFRSRDRRHGK